VNRRILIAGGAVVVLVAAGVGWTLWQEAAAIEDRIRAIETDYETEMRTDSPRLDGVVARIRGFEGWEQEPRLVRMLARIHMFRSNPARAWDVLAPLANAVEPEPQDALLGGLVLMELHQRTGGDGARRAMNLFSDHGTEEEHVFRAWLCARRIGDLERQKQLEQRLQSSYGNTVEADFVDVFARWRDQEQLQQSDIVPLMGSMEDGVYGPDGPPELGLLRAISAVESEDYVRAADIAQRVALEAPELMDIRRACAVALIGQYSVSDLEPADRTRLMGHLQWLLDSGRLDQAERETFEAVLERLRMG